MKLGVLQKLGVLRTASAATANKSRQMYLGVLQQLSIKRSQSRESKLGVCKMMCLHMYGVSTYMYDVGVYKIHLV